MLSANVQYAPYALKEGWATGKPKFLTAIMAVLERYAPGIGKSVRHAELLTPADIETRYLMPGGDWHHGELQADQMLMSRPVQAPPATTRRSSTCSCAAPARIPAAAFRACPGSTPPAASSR